MKIIAILKYILKIFTSSSNILIHQTIVFNVLPYFEHRFHDFYLHLLQLLSCFFRITMSEAVLRINTNLLKYNSLVPEVFMNGRSLLFALTLFLILSKHL